MTMLLVEQHIWILFAVTVFSHIIIAEVSLDDEIPRAIGLLNAYQQTFVQQEQEAQLQKSKERINGRIGSFQPWKSPAKILQDGETLHKQNHTASAVEWLLVYSGQDITPALLLFFAICPVFFGHFVRKYIYRLIKPNLIVKHKGNFPIIPLKYLQETKDEQRVFLPSKNTLSWASTRYIIMASDNVVNLKMLHYGKESEESEQVKYRKHRAWFTIRILAKFNAIYTRNKLEKEKSRWMAEDVGADPKLTQLVKIRRLQERQDEMNQIAELEAERIQKREEGMDDDEEKKEYMYETAMDPSGHRKYTYALRLPEDRVSGEIDPTRVKTPAPSRTRTSMEIMYEGLRRGMQTPHSRLSIEHLRQMSTDSLPEEQKPNSERRLSGKRALKAHALSQKQLMRGFEAANRKMTKFAAPGQPVQHLLPTPSEPTQPEGEETHQLGTDHHHEHHEHWHHEHHTGHHHTRAHEHHHEHTHAQTTHVERHVERRQHGQVIQEHHPHHRQHQPHRRSGGEHQALDSHPAPAAHHRDTRVSRGDPEQHRHHPQGHNAVPERHHRSSDANPPPGHEGHHQPHDTTQESHPHHPRHELSPPQPREFQTASTRKKQKPRDNR